MALVGPALAARIDEVLALWQQGDAALSEKWFLHAANGEKPHTPASSALAVAGLQGVVSAVEGLVMVTQTCDIVRSCLKRPYVEVSPLVTATPEDFRVAERGHVPSRVCASRATPGGRPRPRDDRGEERGLLLAAHRWLPSR